LIAKEIIANEVTVIIIGIKTLNDFKTAGGIFPDSLICNFSLFA